MDQNAFLIHPDDPDFAAKIEEMVAKSQHTFAKQPKKTPDDIVWVNG